MEVYKPTSLRFGKTYTNTEWAIRGMIHDIKCLDRPRILIVTHDHPDADTICSAIALWEMIYLCTDDITKSADIYMDYDTAKRVKPTTSPKIVDEIFCNHSGDGSYTLPDPKQYNVIITVDCPSKAVLSAFPTEDVDYIFENVSHVIDHHRTQNDYNEDNTAHVVVPTAVSTTEILTDAVMRSDLAKLIKTATCSSREHPSVMITKLETSFAQHMILLLECLYTGMLTDSVGFGIDAMTSHSFDMLSKILKLYENIKELNPETVYDCGADGIFAKCYRRHMNAPFTLASKSLLERILHGNMYYPDADSMQGFYIVEIPNNIYVNEDVESADKRIINHICRYGGPNAVAGVVAFETEPGKWSVSLRSIGDFDVSGIAKEYGGGGHKNASGFVLEQTGSVESTIIPDMFKYVFGVTLTDNSVWRREVGV